MLDTTQTIRYANRVEYQLLQLQRDLVPSFVEPVEGLFVLFGADPLFGQVLAASHGDQQKDVVSRCTQGNHQFVDGREFIQVLLSDGGVDLKGEIRFLGICNPPHGPIEGAGDLAEGVVRLGVANFDYTEVLEGLKEGETVFVSGAAGAVEREEGKTEIEYFLEVER